MKEKRSAENKAVRVTILSKFFVPPCTLQINRFSMGRCCKNNAGQMHPLRSQLPLLHLKPTFVKRRFHTDLLGDDHC